MKTFYASILFILTVLSIQAQTYQFGLIHNGGYDFKVVAIPDFDGTNTDISDVGFTLMLPAGPADVINVNSLLAGRLWNTTEFDAAFLTGAGLGDGTRDAWQFNMPPGSSILSHTSAQMIDLVSFSVSNMPTSGLLEFLPNSDSIAIGAGGVLDSFYNANIDMTVTQDYFGGLASGLESFMFETLSLEEIQHESLEIKVFPNPTSDYLQISAPQQISSVVLVDMQGKVVLKFKDNSSKLDLRSLSSGVYFTRIQLASGIISQKRIIRD